MTSVHLSSNPRVLKEADALLEAGYYVHVVATETSVPFEPLDETICADLRWDRTVVTRGTIPLYAWKTLKQRYARKLIHRRGKATYKEAVIAHHRLTESLALAASRIRADLYLAHHLGALPAAATAAKMNGAKLGFDAEDFHTEEVTVEKQDFDDQIARRVIEETLLPRCDSLTAASPLIAQQYRQTYGVSMKPILNVFPLAEAPNDPTAWQGGSSNEHSALRLYWFSQTIGMGRGLEEIAEAMVLMRTPVELYLRGNPDQEFVEKLLRGAGGEDSRERIHILPLVPNRELIRQSIGFDLGLALELDQPLNRSLCLTNKIFAYLLVGLPVLLSKTRAQEAIAEKMGLAALLVDINRPEAVAASLDAFALDTDGRAKASQVAWKLGREQFNWDIEKLKFIESVESQIGRP